MSAPTYDKCHYFVVKALGLADDEEKKFKHRRTKYYYVCNPNVERGDYFVNFTLKLKRKKVNEICTLFVSSADGRKYSRVQTIFFTSIHYCKMFHIPSCDFELVYNVQHSLFNIL